MEMQNDLSEMINNAHCENFWLIPASRKTYDHESAFQKNGYIDWRQGKTSYDVGDFVFIYCSSPIKKVRFLGQIEEKDLKLSEITDDEEFWKNKKKYKEKYKEGKENDLYFRLHLLSTNDSNELSLKKLLKLKNGLKQAPQGPINLGKKKADLCNYLKAIFLTPSDQISQSFQSQDSSKAHTILLNELEVLLENKKQIILTGAPGTGKTYLAKELAAAVIGVPVEMLQGKATPPVQYEFRQFHPGYDYSDFVEGLKPKVTKDGEPHFERVDGVFMAFCKNAAKAIQDDKTIQDDMARAESVINDPTSSDDIIKEAYDIIEKACSKHPYVMVIDEINRADLSRVFGELFYGLEKDYRGEPIPTQYDYLSGGSFSIPPNVYIIGTMNDIDRSVESMDFALRRRFAWQEITVEDSEIILNTISDKGLRYRAIEVMKKVNSEIINQELDLGNAYYLGAAYYRDLEAYSADDANGDEENEWEMLWKHNLAVILTEYIRASRRNQTLVDLHKKYVEIYESAESLNFAVDNQTLNGLSWIISPGENACRWKLFQDESIIAMDFEKGIGDISKIKNIEALKERMKSIAPEHYSQPGALRINGFMLWQFAHSLVSGTVVYARKGTKEGKATILGRGEVVGNYVFNQSREEYNHEIKVKWTWLGEVPYRGTQLARQTLAPVAPGEKLDTLENLCKTQG